MTMSDECEWTTEWPKVPGWYWTWKAGDERVRPMREPVHVFVAGSAPRQFLAYVMAGSFLYPAQDKGLRWGPRIDVPDAPDGTPGTRYAIAIRRAGSVAYLAERGEPGTRAGAAIFTDRQTAMDTMVAYLAAAAIVPDAVPAIEAIDDIDEFRGRPDTW
jgi:hypothetical protein